MPINSRARRMYIDRMYSRSAVEVISLAEVDPAAHDLVESFRELIAEKFDGNMVKAWKNWFAHYCFDTINVVFVDESSGYVCENIHTIFDTLSPEDENITFMTSNEFLQCSPPVCSFHQHVRRARLGHCNKFNVSWRVGQHGVVAVKCRVEYI